MYERWSDEKTMDVVRMRLEGKSLQQIADKYGCSRQNIELALKRISAPKESKGLKACAYAGLRAWLHANNCTMRKLSMDLGIHYGTMLNYLHGQRAMKIGTINAILDYTGLSFEQCFGKVDAHE